MSNAATAVDASDLPQVQQDVIKTPAKRIGEPGGLPGPGRPKGTLNKITQKQREVAEMVLGKPGTPEFEEFVAAQRKDMLAGIMPPPILALWLHYLLGKPKETIDVKGEMLLEKVVREVVMLRVEQPSQLENHAQEEVMVDAVR